MSVQPEAGASVRATAEPARYPFEYAIVRVVPDIERGERINVGVIVGCRARRFIRARTWLDVDRLRVIDPSGDAAEIRRHLADIERIAMGEPGAGPIARLPGPDRFHWLVAPSSTVIQPSRVHTGLTSNPAATLEHLFRTLVLFPRQDASEASVPVADREAGRACRASGTRRVSGTR